MYLRLLVTFLVIIFQRWSFQARDGTQKSSLTWLQFLHSSEIHCTLIKINISFPIASVYCYNATLITLVWQLCLHIWHLYMAGKHHFQFNRGVGHPLFLICPNTNTHTFTKKNIFASHILCYWRNLSLHHLPSQAKRKKPSIPEKPAKKQKSGESSRPGGSANAKGDSNQEDNMFQVRVKSGVHVPTQHPHIYMYCYINNMVDILKLKLF